MQRARRECNFTAALGHYVADLQEHIFLDAVKLGPISRLGEGIDEEID